MDKREAIELLKQCLNKVPKLRELHQDNQKFTLWFDNARNIIKAALTPDDLKRFSFAQPIFSKDFHGGGVYKNIYLAKLTGYETAILSIIQKYEILGIEAELAPIAKENSEQGVMMNNIQPAAFIVHGGRSGVLDKLREFVEALGLKPLVVEMLPSKGMPLVNKVKKYQQEADCAIILATRGGIIDIKSGKQHPRLNVIDELSSFWEAFPEKVILLLEKGVELPSNKAGLTYEPFARQSMDRAFIAIARELTEMKILKAVKPQNGASSSSGDVAPVAKLI